MAIRIEAEAATTLTNYTIQQPLGNFASDNRFIRLNKQSGEAIFSLDENTVQPGVYDVVVGLFDENDGEAELSIRKGGNLLNQLTLNQTLGTSQPNTTSFVEQIVATNVNIEAGDQFAIAGVANLGELAAVDYLEFIPVVTQPQDPIRIEAEEMTWNNYELQFRSFASNSRLIQLPRTTNEGEQGSATTNFTGEAGTYSVTVAFFDENDGVSNAQFLVNGEVIEAWSFDQSPGGDFPSEENRIERLLSTTVNLNPGDEITLTGTRNEGELARFDSIDLQPVENRPDPTPTPEPSQSYADASQGVFANLEQGVGFVSEQAIADPFTILPLGDSITFGVDGEQGFPGVTPTAEQGGYRTQLWNLFQDLGLTVDFVGPLSNGPDNLGDLDHAGFPGARTSDLLNGRLNRNGFTIDGIETWLNEYEPDAILVMSGANNASNDDDVSANMFNQIERLVRRINNLTDNEPTYNNGQGTELILSTITPVDPERQSQIRADNVEAYNQLIRDNIVDDPTDNLDGFVDIGNAVTVDDLAPVSTGDNGLHPTQATYDLMAGLWYEEVLNALGNLDDLSQVDNLIGSNFDDILSGNAADNRIQGGSGNDELTGNGGADTFVYKQLTDGVDVITDFDGSGGDRFEISASGFGNVLTVGTLSSEQLALGTPALDSDDYFLYDTGTGNLFFDIDGSGIESPTPLATLEGSPIISANQFSIVS